MMSYSCICRDEEVATEPTAAAERKRIRMYEYAPLGTRRDEEEST
jgi:hypothetical protein